MLNFFLALNNRSINKLRETSQGDIVNRLIKVGKGLSSRVVSLAFIGNERRSRMNES